MLRPQPKAEQRPVQAVDGCWFCLSNPSCASWLIASVAQEVYLSLDKAREREERRGEGEERERSASCVDLCCYGAAAARASPAANSHSHSHFHFQSPIDPLGHVLVIPVEHFASTMRITRTAWQEASDSWQGGELAFFFDTRGGLVG